MGETAVSIIEAGDTAQAVDALRVLWPRYEPQQMCHFIDQELRPNGYRLVGIQPPGSPIAVSVLGYRVQHSLWLGRSLYVVDIATLPDWCGQGLAEQLMDWVEAEAQRLGCNAVHLDSGVGPERAAAHRLYMRRHYRIGCHHFVRNL